MRKSILLTVLITIFGPTPLIPVMAQDLVYVAVDPCRIVDTRNAGDAITANNFRNFRVSGAVGELAVQGGKTDCLDPKAGTGQEPLAISAYVVAVPATSSTGGGVLTAYPSDQLPPPAGTGSTVNFSADQVIGNTTNITLCDSGSCPTDGEFAILARNTDEHVVIDVQGYFYPLPLEPSPPPPPRFVDNGDGTISDNETGLMWEKKTGVSYRAEDMTDPHNVNNQYTWTAVEGGVDPDGTVFTDFLPRLNKTIIDGYHNVSDAVPFANYTDWRLPTFWELGTLEHCASGRVHIDHMCLDIIFNPAGGWDHWTLTTDARNPTSAYVVNFYNVIHGTSIKHATRYVRAVRGGNR